MIFFPRVAALLGAFALMTPAPALAELIPIKESATGDTYLDSDSIVQDGQYVSLWDVQTYPVPDSQGAVIRRHLMVVDCSNSAAALLRRVGFNHQEQVVYDIKFQSDQIKIDDIYPGTVGGEIYNFVCRYENVTESDSRRRFINNAFKVRY